MKLKKAENTELGIVTWQETFCPFKGAPNYRDTENGSITSRCCGFCKYGSTKVNIDPERPDCPHSFCARFNVLVCHVEGTCDEWERKNTNDNI